MKTIFILLSMTIAGRCWSQSSQSSTEQKRVLIDSMVAVWHEHGFFNGGIQVIQKGKVIYQRFAGYANFEQGILNADTTRFNLASVSKPFTAIAVLQLVEKKKLALEDPFVHYFPDFPYPEVTVMQLLSHTSGLPEADQYEKDHIRKNPAEILSSQKIYKDLIDLKVPPLAVAGEKHFYNNLNYILLALLVEKVSKVPFATYMRKNIFEKAGMKNSFIRERTAANTARYFRPTFYDTAFRHTDSVTDRKIYTDHALGGTCGDNNVVSTMGDMLLFDNALNTGKLLSPELLKVMCQPVKLSGGKYFFTGGKKTYTLGWNQNEKNAAGQFVVWHDGSLVGLTTMLFKNLTDDITYVMYENRTMPNFFFRFLAVSNVIDGAKVTAVPLKKSLVREYGAALVGKGPDFAAARLNELKNSPDWYFHEAEMNELGYDLMRKADFANHKQLAVEVFKLNTMLSPGNANVYDSYAEGLMNAGLKDEAVLMYRKTLLMAPDNKNAKRNLEKLTGAQ